MANLPNVNPSPKQRFTALPSFVDAHRDLIQRPDFSRGVDFAVQELVWELTNGSVNGNDAAANHYKLVVAREFIRIFRTLGETPVMVKSKPGERELPG